MMHLLAISVKNLFFALLTASSSMSTRPTIKPRDAGLFGQGAAHQNPC